MKDLIDMCIECQGTGRRVSYKTREREDGYIAFEGRTEQPCNTCGGRGYFKYCLFTEEEAKAILKHCGLEEGGAE